MTLPPDFGYKMCTDSCSAGIKNDRDLKLVTHLQPVLILGICGALPLSTDYTAIV
jgi:hypothetical protein